MGVRLALAFVLLAFAPAFAQDAPAPMRPSIQADGPAAQNRAPGPAAATPATPAPPVAAYSPIPPPPSAEQCRTACAQAYYFCLAENDVSDCAPAWSHCRLACNKTAAR